MLGCTTNINEQLCVCSMESSCVTPCSTVFHCRNSLYVASCGSVSFYCWKFLLSLPLRGVAFYLYSFYTTLCDWVPCLVLVWIFEECRLLLFCNGWSFGVFCVVWVAVVDRPEFKSRQGQQCWLLRVLSKWVRGSIFLWVKRPRRETHYPPPASVEVRNNKSSWRSP
jgi:hypothetical protein